MQQKAGIVTALEICGWLIIVLGVLGGCIGLLGELDKGAGAGIGIYVGLIFGSIVSGVIMLALAHIAHTLDIQTTRKQGTTKRCPDCAGFIPMEARVCRFCGYRFAVDYFKLGEEYEEKGMTSEAIDMYERAIEDKPDNADAHNNLGMLYEEIGEYEKAVAEYKRAIEINSNFAEAYYNLGDLYEKIGKNSEAMQAYKEYAKLNPEGEDINEIKKKIEQLES